MTFKKIEELPSFKEDENSVVQVLSRSNQVIDKFIYSCGSLARSPKIQQYVKSYWSFLCSLLFLQIDLLLFLNELR
jgi:hypothetical protein